MARGNSSCTRRKKTLKALGHHIARTLIEHALRGSRDEAFEVKVPKALTTVIVESLESCGDQMVEVLKGM